MNLIHYYFFLEPEEKIICGSWTVVLIYKGVDFLQHKTLCNHWFSTNTESFVSQKINPFIDRNHCSWSINSLIDFCSTKASVSVNTEGFVLQKINIFMDHTHWVRSIILFFLQILCVVLKKINGSDSISPILLYLIETRHFFLFL